jgi:hypothetical protein
MNESGVSRRGFLATVGAALAAVAIPARERIRNVLRIGPARNMAWFRTVSVVEYRGGVLPMIMHSTRWCDTSQVARFFGSPCYHGYDAVVMTNEHVYWLENKVLLKLAWIRPADDESKDEGPFLTCRIACRPLKRGPLPRFIVRFDGPPMFDPSVERG